MHPPDIKKSWDDCNVVEQAEIIAYSQLRDIEDIQESNETTTILCKVLGAIR